MRTGSIVIGIVGLAAAAAAAYAYVTGLINFGVTLNAGVCLEDEEIDQALRDGATKAARELADKLLLPDSAPGYAMLTPELQKIIPAAQFDGMAKQVQASGPYRDFKVEHLYQPKVAGDPTRALCGAVSDPERRVTVETAPDATQIHAVLSAKTANNDWAFTFWLIQDEATWRAHAFYVSMASMVGRGPAELMRQARAQETKGHLINAHMLYVAANALMNRGQSFELGVKSELAADLKTHKIPPELAGKPPFKWRLADKDFSIAQATILGVESKLALLLAHSDPAWNGGDLADAERRNRALVGAFVKAHPEYAETFGLVIAQLKGPPAKDVVYNTIFDAKTGYVEPKKETEAKAGAK